jgi:hypothetical protein
LSRDEGPKSKWAQASVQTQLAGQLGRALQGNGRAADALPHLDRTLAYWRGQGAAPDAQRRAAAFDLFAAQAQLALGRPAEARTRAQGVVEQLAPLCEAPADLAAPSVYRDAWLTRAEAHALLMQCEPGARDRHRTKALAALSAAQALRPLAADHQALLAQLRG